MLRLTLQVPSTLPLDQSVARNTVLPSSSLTGVIAFLPSFLSLAILLCLYVPSLPRSFSCVASLRNIIPCKPSSKSPPRLSMSFDLLLPSLCIPLTNDSGLSLCECVLHDSAFRQQKSGQGKHLIKGDTSANQEELCHYERQWYC